MTGPEMKFIRTKCGYTGSEFGDFIEKSERTVYRMEDICTAEIKARHVDALRQFVGAEHFDRYAAEWAEKKEAERKWREERDAERTNPVASSRPSTFMRLKKYRG